MCSRTAACTWTWSFASGKLAVLLAPAPPTAGACPHDRWLRSRFCFLRHCPLTTWGSAAGSQAVQAASLKPPPASGLACHCSLLTAHCSLLLLLALMAFRYYAPSLGLMAARGVEYLHQVRVREQRGAVGAEWGETRTLPFRWNGRLLPHQTPWACTCLCPHCAPTAPSLAPSLPPHCLS